MSDDTKAREERAARLRKQIGRLTGKDQPEAGSVVPIPETEEATQRRRPPRVGPVSPRTFVERRMRELDGDKDKKD
jgi:hypothetical protein